MPRTYASSSGEQSASAVISAVGGALTTVCLLPPATGTATLKLYDNASAASGTIVFECSLASTSPSVVGDISAPIIFNKGLYASLTGTTTYTVAYVPS